MLHCDIRVHLILDVTYYNSRMLTSQNFWTCLYHSHHDMNIFFILLKNIILFCQYHPAPVILYTANLRFYLYCFISAFTHWLSFTHVMTLWGMMLRFNDTDSPGEGRLLSRERCMPAEVFLYSQPWAPQNELKPQTNNAVQREILKINLLNDFVRCKWTWQLTFINFKQKGKCWSF